VGALTWGSPYENGALGDFTSLIIMDERLKLPKEDLEQNVRDTVEGKYPAVLDKSLGFLFKLWNPFNLF